MNLLTTTEPNIKAKSSIYKTKSIKSASSSTHSNVHTVSSCFDAHYFTQANSKDDLLKLDLEKINQFIQILSEHITSLEKESKFQEASNAKAKLISLQRLQYAKVVEDLKIKHEETLNRVYEEKNKELELFHINFDSTYQEIEVTCSEMQSQLNQKHKNEFETEMKKFNLSFTNQIPKATPEILDLQKRLDIVIKKKDYQTANQLKEKINQLTEDHETKWNNVIKNQKKELEINKLKTKQTNEYNNLKRKIETMINEFNAKRKFELDKIEAKFYIKEKMLKSQHINTLNELDGPAQSTLIKSYGNGKGV